MLKLIVAIDPRPHTKARDLVRVAQALDRGLVGLLFFMPENVTRFQPPENVKKSLIRWTHIDIMPSRLPTFFHEEPLLRQRGKTADCRQRRKERRSRFGASKF